MPKFAIWPPIGRYLRKDIVEELLDSPDGLKMGGKLRQVTILVSDLRGLTSLASRLPHQQVIEILNRYLERQAAEAFLTAERLTASETGEESGV